MDELYHYDEDVLSREEKISLAIRGERHPRAYFLDEEVQEMRDRAEDGEDLFDIADDFGVDYRYLRYVILKGRVYKHLIDDPIQAKLNTYH